jgi:AraC family transcriptional regulator
VLRVAGSDAAREAVRDVIATMRAEVPRGRLELADMADIAHLSPYHFIRVFRDATGTPPGAFQAALRLAEAKRRIATTDIPVTELCFDLGYSSLGTFVARFTAGVGLSPARYRRLVTGLVVPSEPTLTQALSVPATGPAALRGVLTGAPAGGGPVFVGVFPQYLPSGVPLGGTTRLGNGPFAIGPLADGT